MDTVMPVKTATGRVKQRIKRQSRDSNLSKTTLERHLKAGLTANEIAEKMNVHRSTIYRAITRLNLNQCSPDEFRKERADILAMDQLNGLTLQNAIREYFSRKDLDKMKDADLIGLYKALGLDIAVKFDKERLERNRSMGDIRIFTMIYERADRLLFEESVQEVEVQPVLENG